jgi:hypothetical protein
MACECVPRRDVFGPIVEKMDRNEVIEGDAVGTVLSLDISTDYEVLKALEQAADLA